MSSDDPFVNDETFYTTREELKPCFPEDLGHWHRQNGFPEDRNSEAMNNINLNDDLSNKNEASEYLTTEAGPVPTRRRSLSQFSVGSFSVHDEDVNGSDGDAFVNNASVPDDIDVDATVNRDNQFSGAESFTDSKMGGAGDIFSAEDNRKDVFETGQMKQGVQKGRILTQRTKDTSMKTLSSSIENEFLTVDEPPDAKPTANNVSNGDSDKNDFGDYRLKSEGSFGPNERASHEQNQQIVSTVGTGDNNTHQTLTNSDGSRKPPEQHQQNNQQQGQNEEVIELLDDDDANTIKNKFIYAHTMMSAGMKRPRASEQHTYLTARPNVPGYSAHGYQPSQRHQNLHGNGKRFAPHHSTFQQDRSQQQCLQKSSTPHYFSPPSNHRPTWEFPLPTLNIPSQPAYMKNSHKHFELSLLNVSEFTIIGLPVSFDGRPSSVLGFRKIIKEVSRGHGKPVFERDNPKSHANIGGETSLTNNNDYGSHGDIDNPDGGKWRIPLGAYRAFFSYLKSDIMCKVQGIPEDQLKIASLGKARLEKGYPSVQKIISYGVPKGLAMALAPFQRGGVDFVVEKEGRALIADDMGLGKTIQSIAGMSIYHDEWPLLILTPSSARYHWAAEFNNWLGSESSVNNGTGTGDGRESDLGGDEDCARFCSPRTPMELLKESEIHVMVAGKEKVLPTIDTRIVVCSYGLATSLIESGKIYKGLFKCAIVDESHMLKNIKTKRTSKLIPILHATNRCILLSGTPAFARPSELWPQLKILSTERDGWWEDEGEFVKKYVQRTSAIRRAELHTMLTGTVMIRRLKHNILKSLPSKQREKAIVDVVTPDARREFQKCMELLREGKGVMAKIAKKHLAKSTEGKNNLNDPTEKNKLLLDEYNERYRRKIEKIQLAIQTMPVNKEQKEDLMMKYTSTVRAEVDGWYTERCEEMNRNGSFLSPEKPEEELDRKRILNKMYSLTAEAKIPLIAKLLSKWLDDPTKGKLCIFAHHICVLDEVSKLAGLSNEEHSRRRFIRIDGSTNPKERQSQIVAFQNDPDIRIAVLGITAAGVAVTLTASSTVWFAELFWTPALMIQAEDRCHRIGQNATVKCLYFVATGTLDVLLWDLLEKKFQDLGEFVEGKEKMKIVVQKTFKSTKELESIFMRSDDYEIEDETKSVENENPVEGDDLITLENDLQDDICQLAQDEMIMMSQGDDEDGTDNKVTGKTMPMGNSAQTKAGLGQTEDEAICLSDDEGDTSPQKEATNPTTSRSQVTDASDKSPWRDISHMRAGFQYRRSRVLEKYRFYKQYFEGSSFGIQLIYIDHRLAVAKNTSGNRKPALGDVLVAVNGYRLPVACQLDDACKYMKNALAKGTVELMFVEDELFMKHSATVIERRRDGALEANSFNNEKPRSAPKETPTEKDEVIEILD